ncbi:MAG: HAD family hydrolase [Deltaproteobacteria bacterium]|nr:HAD family hydrolase [Deltaproteobacteria bacterium]
MNNNIKVVAFDCDGVLFDTKEVNRMYYNNVLKYMGIPPLTPEQLDYAHMQTAHAVLRTFFKDENSYNKADAFRTAMDYTPFVGYMKIEPFLKTLLKKLKPKYKLAIATNRTNTMPTVLKEFGLEQYFNYVVCALDVKNPKPDPEQLYKILDFFKVEPKQVIYIGDAETDEKASYAAGVPFVAYNNKNLKADFYISQLNEMENIIGV